jgi:hypothetical protein
LAKQPVGVAVGVDGVAGGQILGVGAAPSGFEI